MWPCLNAPLSWDGRKQQRCLGKHPTDAAFHKLQPGDRGPRRGVLEASPGVPWAVLVGKQRAPRASRTCRVGAYC